LRSAQADHWPKASGGRIHSAPQADHRPKAPTPIEIGLPRRSAPGAGLRRRRRHFCGRRRPTAGRRPLEAEFIRRPRPTIGQRHPRRLKSASQGAPRQASASANAEGIFAVGAGRPLAEGPWRPNSFGVQADRRPKAPTPIEIGLPRRSAPGTGLRQRRRHFCGRRRPTIGRRPLEAEFIRHPRPTAGRRPSRPNSFGAPGRPSAKGAHAN